MWTPLIFGVIATQISLAVSQNAIAPSHDDWYDQPANISDYALGQMIRTRQVSNRLQSLSTMPVHISVESVYQYMFRSTDSLDNPIGAVATLMVPYNSDPRKLLSYQLAYDTSNPDCSPSYLLRYRSILEDKISFLNSTTVADVFILGAALNQGWWVLTTDYEGPNGHYLVGPVAGRTTLDSVRMILNEGPKIGLSPDVRYALAGYSGGAVPCAWAAEIQPWYAPELRFAGAAFGGVIVNVSSALERGHDGIYSTLLFQAMNGFSKAYPNFTDWLDAKMLPEKKDSFRRIVSACTAEETLAEARFSDFFSFLVDRGDSFSDPVPTSVFQWAGLMGMHGVPTMPSLMYQAVNDEVSPGWEMDQLIDQYCAQGATIEYQRNMMGTHFTAAIPGSAQALKWLSDRLDGKGVGHEGSCVKRDLSLTALDEGAMVYLGTEAITILTLLLGGRLGGGSLN